MESPCLFDLTSDPCERKNIALSNQEVLATIETKLFQYRKEVLPARNKPADLSADPKYWKGAWVNWKDPPTSKKPHQMTLITLILIVTLFIIVILVLLVISVRNTSSSLKQNIQVDRIFRNFETKRRNSRTRSSELFSELEVPTTSPHIRTID